MASSKDPARAIPSARAIAQAFNHPGRLLAGTLALLAALTVFSGCGPQKAVTLKEVQQRGKLVAGVKFDSKPFGYLDTKGQLNGYDIALMRELGHRLLSQANGKPGPGKTQGSETDSSKTEKIEFQQVLSSTRVIALNAGSVDVVGATMTITPERAKVVDFSTPYYIAHQAVLVPNDSKLKALDDLNGHTILFVLGSTSETHIKKRLPKAKYIGFKSVTDAISALKAKRGDAITSDDSILYGFLADNCGYHLLDERLSDEPYGLAFRKGSGGDGKTLKNAINDALKAMQADGTLERLQQEWIEGDAHKNPCHS